MRFFGPGLIDYQHPKPLAVTADKALCAKTPALGARTAIMMYTPYVPKCHFYLPNRRFL
jgi:hypothetical protein